MALEPVEDPTAANWITESDTDWWTLACQGPTGFESMATIWFDEGDAEPYRSDLELVRGVLEILTCGSDEQLWFAVWDGWGETVPYSTRRPRFWESWRFFWFGPPKPRGHRGEPSVTLRGFRDFFLFRGSVNELGAWRPGAVLDEFTPPPAMVWPDDHSWFLAADVDPDWFTVSGPGPLLEQFLADPQFVSAPARHGELPPIDDH